MNLLDAGCGTGSYSKAFLEHGIGKVSAMDASEDMLAKAREKLVPYLMQKRMDDIKWGELPTMPFPDSSFDVIALIQVLQHLDKPFEGFWNAKTTLTEALRVLKPGGVIVINHCSHDQLRYGAWYYNLIPHTVEKLCDHYIPHTELLSFLEQLGYENALSVVSPWEIVYPQDKYFNKEGPFDETWRKMDPTWKLADLEGELESALKSLKEKKDFDMLDDWFEQVEQKRKNVGKSTCIFVQKPHLNK